MTVYVDPAIHPYGRMIMCHMASPDLDELHAMADRIGVARRWFQDPRTMRVSAPHYDIAKSKRSLAVAAGAKEIDRYQMSVITKLALYRLPGLEHMRDRDPLAHFRRTNSARLPEMEAWLNKELGQ